MTTMSGLQLEWLPGEYSICRLEPGPPPEWATGGYLWAISGSEDELSVLTESDRVPAGVRHEAGWVGLKVAGPLDFALTGVLSSLAEPLARAGVSIFALSTFDTDYLLVRQWQRARAAEALGAAGHHVQSP